MPQRKPVKTTFQKASVTPSARAKRISSAHTPAAKSPSGLSPLAAYIEENRDSGIPVRELIAQFQEYDCEHPKDRQVFIAVTSEFQILECDDCGLVYKNTKPGASNGNLPV